MKGLDAVDFLIEAAKAAGADAADAVYFDSRSLGLSRRLGQKEDIERSESQDVGLRVFVGQSSATVSSSDLKRPTLETLVERAVAMAKLAPKDPYSGIAGPEQIMTDEIPDLDLADPTSLTPEQLDALAAEAEETARAVKGVTNSDGASASTAEVSIALAASNGFRGAYRTTSSSFSVSVVAGEGTGMERDYAYSAARHAGDLESAAAIGREAGERAVKRLNPKKAKTGAVPIVFDPRASNSLVGHFSGAINGSSVARGTSFLKDSLGKPVFAPGIQILDDPLRKRGIKSRPFDGEGIAAEMLAFVEDGVLIQWVLDLASARQLGLMTNGRAARGTSTPPSPSTTNLYMAAGSVSPKDLMADITSGIYVTELIGMGVNGVTGDYSRGASGFWIENGEIAWPVSEITIASNLKDMFKRMTPADDLVFKYGTNAPTVRVEGMTVAGL